MKAVILILAALLAAFSQSIPMPGPGMPASTTGGGGGGTCTPASGYAHCRVLVIDHTQVGGSTLTNFPVLVSATLGSARIQNSNCYDVVFTSDSEGAARIPWEQETCVQSTGAIVDWVGISSVSGGSDTRFYVSYGNVSVTTAQNTGAIAPTNVWDSSYKAVWHLGNGTTLQVTDSTNTGNNLTNAGAVSAVAGHIDGAASLSGTNYLSGPNISAIDGATQFTLSFWVNPSTVASNSMYFSQYNSGGFLVEGQGLGTLKGYIGAGFYDNSAAYLTPGTWVYIAYVFDGTQPTNATKLVDYINGIPGALSVTGTVPSTLSSSGGAPFMIAPIDTTRLTGLLDEVEVSTGVARSGAWIVAQYNNQKSFSTFLTVGGEI